MKVAVLNIGNELLKGSTLNSNLLSIGKALFRIGNPPILQMSVNDDEDGILSSLEYILLTCDTVIISGGLGPTTDDITVDVVSKYLGLELIFDNSLSIHIGKVMGKNFTLNENKQALIPKGATVINNINGTAPGLCMEKDGKTFFLLPGPPIEMEPMLENFVIPKLLKISSEKSFFKSVYSFGKVESAIQGIVQEKVLPDEDISVAYRVDQGGCEITFYGKSESKVSECHEKLRVELGKAALEEGCINIISDVLNKLKRKGLALSLAESCTGGMLASKIVDIPGASKVFKGGVVAYDNTIKENVLKVKNETLIKYGAVSSECAKEMLEGCSHLFNSSVTVAITGIAGPTGGTDNKNVGLVYVGVKIKSFISVKKYEIYGDRAKVRTRACIFALKDMRDILIDCEI